MKRNIGDIDAVIRIMIGFALAYIYYTAVKASSLQTVGMLFALYLLLTSVQGVDPFYRILKIDTCRGNSCIGCVRSRDKKNIEKCDPSDENHSCENC